ncbi:glucosidase 2 subunit beta [Cylas formicarius]|uniref:glucosidase 2 subunit beta n=1 Tax=Cylas formicarius TaxID=197179 RepID=UPI00295874B9|nr:glucosidase 2 subunit beta [Cylas formicarius]
MNLIKESLFLNIFTISVLTAGSEIIRPRGVSLSRAGLYAFEGNFTCFDGAKSIPFTQVNDDYCDCVDGSDEPGTSACPNGIFHCVNAGHRPLNIPSSRVNDGVCDCCDGADEYAGRVSCTNNCLELGKTAREEAQKQAELLKVGKQLRQELSQQGLKLKEVKNQKLSDLKRNRDEAESIKAEKEQLKKQAEEVEEKALEYYRELEKEYKNKKAEKEAEKDRNEAMEEFKKLDINQDGVVDVGEIQSRASFDRDRNGEVSEEEAKLFLGSQESVDLNTFLEKSWRLIKPFIMMDSGMYKPPVSNEQSGDDVVAQDDEGVEPEVAEATEQDDDEDEENEEEKEEEKEETEPPTEERVSYDEETQKLVDEATEARNQFTQADTNLRTIENEIKSIEESLTRDFGSEEEFATLEGNCFDYEDREYVYRFCPFDKTLQIPKSSSSETRLGKWKSWSGPEPDPYSEMLYDGGQSCWNGPQRSTKVKVSCGTENKVTSVAEPNRCEYHFDFSTPAACRAKGADSENQDLHDEL